MRNYRIAKIFSGLVILIVGIILLLKTFGILEIPISSAFATYWPIGLMLMGLALIFRLKGLAWVICGITIIMAILFGVSHFSDQIGDLREFNQEIQINEDTETLHLSLSFGAAEVKINKGTADLLLTNHVSTSDLDDPKITVYQQDSIAKVDIERSGTYIFGKRPKDNWNLDINPSIKVNLELDFGAAEINLDISELMVDKIDFNSGASKAEIKFGEYPTNVDINTGASKLLFKFPSNYGVMITIDGGAVSKNFDGFVKKGNNYFSPGFNENENNIIIDIDAGATEIISEFY